MGLVSIMGYTELMRYCPNCGEAIAYFNNGPGENCCTACGKKYIIVESDEDEDEEET